MGVVPTFEALRTAGERGLDLVEVAPTASPPVCRLMDYGKYKYEQTKKEREAKKNQKIVLLKEMRLRPKIDEHDLEFKTRLVQKFLEEGDKVKVTIRFRGREMSHQDLGQALAKRIQEDVGENGQVESFPRLEGRQMVMMIGPKKKQ